MVISDKNHLLNFLLCLLLQREVHFQILFTLEFQKNETLSSSLFTQ